MCRHSILGCLANLTQNSESEPQPARGIVARGIVACGSLGVVKCLGTPLRLLMQFEIAAYVFTYYIF